jgi:hypothetical protein
VPERIPPLAAELEKLDEKVDERHEENEHRFDKIEQKLAETSGMLRLAVALIVANGGINLWLAARAGKG